MSNATELVCKMYICMVFGLICMVSVWFVHSNIRARVIFSNLLKRVYPNLLRLYILVLWGVENKKNGHTINCSRVVALTKSASGLFCHHGFHLEEWQSIICRFNIVKPSAQSNTIDSRYLEFQGTLWNTSRYTYLDISDLQNWGKNNSNNHI